MKDHIEISCKAILFSFSHKERNETLRNKYGGGYEYLNCFLILNSKHCYFLLSESSGRVVNADEMTERAGKFRLFGGNLYVTRVSLKELIEYKPHLLRNNRGIFGLEELLHS